MAFTDSERVANVVLADTGSASAPSISFLGTLQSSSGTGFFLKSPNVIGVAVGGTEVFNFSSSGGSEIGELLLADGSAALPSLTFTSDNTTGLYYAGSNGLGIATNATNAVTINSTQDASFAKRVAVGGALSSSGILSISGNPLSGATQQGLRAIFTGTSAATTGIQGLAVTVSSAAASFTCTNMVGLRVAEGAKGSGSTITNSTGLLIDQPTIGTNNCILSDNTSYIGSFAINLASTSGSLLSGALTLSVASNQLVIKPGANSFTITGANPAGSVVYTLPDAGGAANFVLSASAQTLSAALTLSSAPTLTAASNQLVIQPSGSGNTFSITAANPAASRVITLPDPGGAASFVLNAGASSIAGVKSFSAGTCFTRTNVSSTATINSLSSASSFIKLTGSTATTINGIAAGTNGQMIIIWNATGQNMTISNNNAGGASGEKITTNTGADVVSTGNGSAILMYDTDASPAVWVLVGSLA